MSYHAAGVRFGHFDPAPPAIAVGGTPSWYRILVIAVTALVVGLSYRPGRPATSSRGGR